MKLFIAVSCAVLLALPVVAQTTSSTKMAETFEQLQQATTQDEALPLLAYIVKSSTEAPLVLLFSSAAQAMKYNQIEDAAFLFYVAQLRMRYDFALYKPTGSGGDSPLVMFNALFVGIGSAINPAIMREPKMFDAVVKRVESWAPVVPPGYDPGWPYTPGKPEEAQEAFTTHLASFRQQMGGFSTLLNDPEYFAAFMVVQDAMSSMEEPDEQHLKAKKAAEATMLEIERTRGIQGLYYRKP